MAEAQERYVVQFAADFPRPQVEALGAELMATGVLAPGFIPPPAGLLRLEAIVFSKDQQGYDTVMLPDRNLVSRMSRVARDGHADLKDKTTRSAVALMAFCQAMNIDIEPAMAFHELGAVSGNAVARDELSWFRAADRGAARQWAPLSDLDFEKPIGRWRRNYVVALKAAELELSPATAPIDRALALLDWMDTDFLLAGPAAMFVSMYYGPSAARGGLFKQLRSANRKAATAGVKNASWDMTYLSDFALRVVANSPAALIEQVQEVEHRLECWRRRAIAQSHVKRVDRYSGGKKESSIQTSLRTDALPSLIAACRVSPSFQPKVPVSFSPLACGDSRAFDG